MHGDETVGRELVMIMAQVGLQLFENIFHKVAQTS